MNTLELAYAATSVGLVAPLSATHLTMSTLCESQPYNVNIVQKYKKHSSTLLSNFKNLKFKMLAGSRTDMGGYMELMAIYIYHS